MLDDLIFQERYDRDDYLKAMKSLLPRGRLWRIPLPVEQDIKPISILSEEFINGITFTYPHE